MDKGGSSDDESSRYANQVFGYQRNGLPYVWFVCNRSNSRIHFELLIRKPNLRVLLEFDTSLSSQGSSRRVLLDAIQCKIVQIFIAISRVPALDILLSSKLNMLQSAITPPIILYRWRHSSEIWVLYST